MADELFSLSWNNSGWPPADFEEPLPGVLPHSTESGFHGSDFCPVGLTQSNELFHENWKLAVEDPSSQANSTRSMFAAEPSWLSHLPDPEATELSGVQDLRQCVQDEDSSRKGREAGGGQATQGGDLLDIASIKYLLFSDVADVSQHVFQNTEGKPSSDAVTSRPSSPSSIVARLPSAAHASARDEASLASRCESSMQGANVLAGIIDSELSSDGFACSQRLSGGTGGRWRLDIGDIQQASADSAQPEAGENPTDMLDEGQKLKEDAGGPCAGQVLQADGRPEGKQGGVHTAKGRFVAPAAAGQACLDRDRGHTQRQTVAGSRVPNLSIRLASIIDDLGERDRNKRKLIPLQCSNGHEGQPNGATSARPVQTCGLRIPSKQSSYVPMGDPHSATMARAGQSALRVDKGRETRKRLHCTLASAIADLTPGKLNSSTGSSPGSSLGGDDSGVDFPPEAELQGFTLGTVTQGTGTGHQRQGILQYKDLSSVRWTSSTSSRDKLHDILRLAGSVHVKVLLLMDNYGAEFSTRDATSRRGYAWTKLASADLRGSCRIPSSLPLEGSPMYGRGILQSPLACRLDAQLSGSVCSAPAPFFSDKQLKERLVALATALATQDKTQADNLQRQLSLYADAKGCGSQRLCHQVLYALRLRTGAAVQEQSVRFLDTGDSRPIETPSFKPALDDTSDALLESKMQYFARTPFVKFFFVATSTAILRMIRFRKRIHIVDFGYMLGAQWIKTIRDLGNRPCGPPLSMRMTTVTSRHRREFYPAQVASKEAEQIAALSTDLEQAAADAGIAFFEHKTVNMGADDMSELWSVEGRITDWASKGFTPSEREEEEFLAVRGCIDMESLPDGSVIRANVRDSVLSFFRGMQPDLFLLMGQNMDSNNPFFLSRFRECIDMYASAYDCHDETLLPFSPTALLFEEVLHAGSIRNIVACEGLQRMVRAERAEQWRARMLRLGFQYYQDGFDSGMQDVLYATTKDCPDGFGLSIGDGFVQLLWKGRALVYVSLWHA